MISKTQYQYAQQKAENMIWEAGIVITDEEAKHIEVADFGLSNLEQEGGQILTFFNTNRIATKVVALFPNQTLPEHWHPPIDQDPGKEETIRIINGTVRMYTPGEDTLSAGFIPTGKEKYYTVRHETIMKPGDQMTLIPGTKHWFQTDEEGAVLYSFSTCVRDILDRFSDPNIIRTTEIDE